MIVGIREVRKTVSVYAVGDREFLSMKDARDYISNKATVHQFKTTQEPLRRKRMLQTETQTTTHMLANKIKVDLSGDGRILTILSSAGGRGANDLIVFGADDSKVSLRAKIELTSTNHTIVQVMAFDCDVNTTLFGGMFSEIVDIKTRSISTGGGHNDADTYDEDNIKIAGYGTISVDQSIAEAVIEQDRIIESQKEECSRLEKEYRLTARKLNDKRQEVQQTASEIITVQ